MCRTQSGGASNTRLANRAPLAEASLYQNTQILLMDCQKSHNNPSESWQQLTPPSITIAARCTAHPGGLSSRSPLTAEPHLGSFHRNTGGYFTGSHLLELAATFF